MAESTMFKPNDAGPQLSGDVTAYELSYEFPGRVLWSDLTFTLEGGQVMALCGPSGSGKTTLLQCIGSLDQPTSGNISVSGVSVNNLKGKEHRQFLRHSVGFLFQNTGIVASWSVRKNLEVSGARVRGQGSKISSETIEAFEHFGLSPKLIDTTAYRLSGGEQQRVAMMRLALRRPAVLLLDEPSSALDDENTEKLMKFIERHCQDGGSAIIATHDARIIEKSDELLRL